RGLRFSYCFFFFFFPERALETCDIRSISSSSSTLRGRHLSKSASELSCNPRCDEMAEIRPRSAAPPEHTHISVYQKAHSFFAQLKFRPFMKAKSEQKIIQQNPSSFKDNTLIRSKIK
ncbi:hypothetical protein AMK59_852, partial [Oryctes borbonicus]